MQEQASPRKSHRKNDILLIGVLLLAALLGVIYLYFFRDDGDQVKVTVDGEIYGVYALSEDRREEIRHGEHSNVLVIQNGRAKIESASCPDGICVSHHAIRRDGESIVCLPNRVVVTVTSAQGESPDVIA